MCSLALGLAHSTQPTKQELAAKDITFASQSLLCASREELHNVVHAPSFAQRYVVRLFSPAATPTTTHPSIDSEQLCNFACTLALCPLCAGWEVDQAIMKEEDRVVVIRFGRDSNKECMVQDEVLFGIAERVKNFAVIYLVDIDEVPDFNGMYELYDECTTMFFYRNKHIMVDLGTGNNNKINWALPDHQELTDIIEIVYRGARKGRGLVVSPKDYSTKYRY